MSDLHVGDLHVGYILKQYPRLSETFILNEILGLERAGVDVSVFSLNHATEGRFHPELARVVASVHYMAPVDKSSFLAALRALPALRTQRLADVIDFVGLLAPERQARLLLHAIEVADQVQRSNIDHLHAHFLTGAAHVAHIAHLLTGVPYTVTAHAKDIYRHTVDWELAARLANSAAAIVTVCDANLRHLAVRLDGVGTSLVRIYNGLTPNDPPTALEQRTRHLVVAVGRLVEKKGFDVLLDALADLAPRLPDIACVLVGDGDQRAALAAQANMLGIEDRVTFTGSLPQHQVGALLRRAHVMAAPCKVGADGNQDALPTVLLEALSAGLPAVTTPVAGIPEIIEHGREGLIVPPDDAHAVAEALDKLLTDDDGWREMSSNGPRKLATTFNRQSTIAQLVETFETARSEPRSELPSPTLHGGSLMASLVGIAAGPPAS